MAFVLAYALIHLLSFPAMGQQQYRYPKKQDVFKREAARQAKQQTARQEAARRLEAGQLQPERRSPPSVQSGTRGNRAGDRAFSLLQAISHPLHDFSVDYKDAQSLSRLQSAIDGLLTRNPGKLVWVRFRRFANENGHQVTLGPMIIGTGESYKEALFQYLSTDHLLQENPDLKEISYVVGYSSTGSTPPLDHTQLFWLDRQIGAEYQAKHRANQPRQMSLPQESRSHYPDFESINSFSPNGGRNWHGPPPGQYYDGEEKHCETPDDFDERREWSRSVRDDDWF